MHKPGQSELQLDQSQLLYSDHLGPVQQETTQPNVAKRPTTFKLATSMGSWEIGKDRSPRKKIPPRFRTTRNISVVPLQEESRPTTPHQQLPNHTEGVNRIGAEPQPLPRIPINNVNAFIEVLQLLQHSQQQMMEEICQLKMDKTKEKGSQHDLKHASDKEETPIGGVPQNAKQHFITMAEIAALLEQERAKAPKERFYARRPPYLSRVPYPERYEP